MATWDPLAQSPQALAFSVVLPLLAAFLYWWCQPVLNGISISSRLRDLPGPAPKSWLMGNVPDMILRPVQQQVLAWVTQWGPIFKLRFTFLPVVVITDPDTIGRLIKAGPDMLPKTGASYRLFRQLTHPFRDNILTTNDQEYHRAVRKGVTPAFSASCLRQVFPRIVAITQNINGLIRSHDPATPFDMDLLTQRLAVDVLGHFMFDRDFQASGGGDSKTMGTASSGAAGGYGDALYVIQQLMSGMQLRLNPINRWMFWTKNARQFRIFADRFEGLIERGIADMLASPPAPHALMAHLLAIKDPSTGQPLDLAQLKSESAVFWIAGYETTAHAISWALMYVATDAQVEGRLASELAHHGLLATPDQPTPRALQWSDLGALTYLNAVVQESLRLMPPASGGTARQPGKDITISGHFVPKGAMVWMPTYSVHRSPLNWPEPDVFQPERWLGAAGADAALQKQQALAAGGETTPDGDQEGMSKRRGWLPFSEGPRNCVGMTLALTELRVALALLCGAFTFRLAPEVGGRAGAEAAARQHITLKPGGPGLLMHAMPRA